MSKIEFNFFSGVPNSSYVGPVICKKQVFYPRQSFWQSAIAAFRGHTWRQYLRRNIVGSVSLRKKTLKKIWITCSKLPLLICVFKKNSRFSIVFRWNIPLCTATFGSRFFKNFLRYVGKILFTRVQYFIILQSYRRKGYRYTMKSNRLSITTDSIDNNSFFPRSS